MPHGHSWLTLKTWAHYLSSTQSRLLPHCQGHKQPIYCSEQKPRSHLSLPFPPHPVNLHSSSTLLPKSLSALSPCLHPYSHHHNQATIDFSFTTSRASYLVSLLLPLFPIQSLQFSQNNLSKKYWVWIWVMPCIGRNVSSGSLDLSNSWLPYLYTGNNLSQGGSNI